MLGPVTYTPVTHTPVPAPVSLNEAFDAVLEAGMSFWKMAWLDLGGDQGCFDLSLESF